MSTLCVIPARGGSKRIPGKNIREFRGRPIIAWSIRAALDSGLFARMTVSTDDAATAEIARAAGADTPFPRRPETANDQAGLMAVLAEVAAAHEAAGERYDRLFCVLATAPLLTAERLREAAAMMDAGAGVVLTVSPFDYPPQRALGMDADGAVAMLDPAQAEARSQDLALAYRDAAQLYGMDWATAKAGRPILTGGARGLIVSPLEQQDIDVEDDWAMAELKFDRLRAMGRL